MAITNNYDMAHSFFYNLNGSCEKSWMTTSYYKRCFYSYSTVIGQMTEDINGHSLLIISYDNFSNTTAKHISILRQASPCYNIIYLPQSYGGREFNANYCLERIEESLKSLKEGLTRQENRQAFKGYYYLLNNFLKVKSFKPLFERAIELQKEYKPILDICNNEEALKELKKANKQASILKAKKTREANKQKEQLLQSFLTNHSYMELIEELCTGWNNDILIQNEAVAIKRKDLKAKYNLDYWAYCYISKDGIFKTSKRITIKDLQPIKILLQRYFMNKDILGLKVEQYTVLEVNKAYIRVGCHRVPMQNVKELAHYFGIDTTNRQVA